MRRYGDQLWVTGISMGIKEIGGEIDDAAGTVIAIHIRLKQELARVPRANRIPPTILGVATDVIEGTYTPSSNGAHGSALPIFPLRPGSSFARSNGTAATLAGVLRDASGVRYLLSSGHVLREGGGSRKGDLLVHPGPDDSRQPAGVARYESVHLGYDAGIARLEPGIQAVNRALLSNHQILAPQMPRIGDVLEKSGRSTQLTQAEVSHIGTFDHVYPVMRLVLRAGASPPISEKGDSGSMWYDTTTFAAKGLHIGIDSRANRPTAVAT
ncbi:MAG TPA: hypothetical protein VN605_03370, partial [Thermoanaerobaculia bacterium]|nr:hypothetical protein [Thermoanaerobaculia bacterium]